MSFVAIGAVGAGISLAGGIGSTIQSYNLSKKQQEEADSLNPVRPEYSIPDEIKTQKNLYQGLANQAQLPGQKLISDDINQSASNALNTVKSASGSSADALAAASGIAGKQSGQYRDLAVAGAQQQRQAQQLYGQSLGTMAEYQDKKFNLNEMIPFMNEVEKKEALTAAAQGNKQAMWQGISSTGDSVTSIASGGLRG